MSLTEQERLGVTLFHKRKELSLLQGDIAAMVGVEKPTISSYECGVVKKYCIAHTCKIGTSIRLVAGRNSV